MGRQPDYAVLLEKTTSKRDEALAMTTFVVPAAREPRTSRSLLAWGAWQFLTAIYGLVWMLLIGVVAEIVTRRFRWRAFAMGTLFMAAGVTGTTMAIQVDPNRFGDNAVILTWSAALVVAAITGCIIARLSRGIGYWESYLAMLVCLGAGYVQLRWGFHNLAMRLTGQQPSYVELFAGIEPGHRMLGDLWLALLIMWAAIGHTLMVFGGSLVFLVYGEDGVADFSFGYERFMALRQLSSQRKGLVSVTAIVAILGVAVGVAALVAVTAVMSGYQDDIQARILSTNAHLVVQKYGVDFSEHAKVAEIAREVPEVIASTPFVFNEASFSYGEHGLGVLLKGVVPETAGDVTEVTRNLCERVEAGRCVPFAEPSAAHFVHMLRPDDGVPGIVVGLELFKRQGMAIGDLVTLTTPVSLANVRNTAPKRMQFRVTGVFRSGMHEFDSRLTYLELEASQELLGLGHSVSGVELKLTDPQRVEAIASKVLRAVGRYPYRTLDWRELNQGIFRALFLQKTVFYSILVNIIVVAAFNIASTLFMTVIEKAREIGVLKSMGASDASIMKIFVIEGWIVGLVGTAIGLALGIGVAVALSQLKLQIAADVYMVDSLTVRLRPLEIVLTAFAAFVISHLATIYPAMRAAKQRPVDAMRYD
jgi:lipoprotein-releasing system permease protein